MTPDFTASAAGRTEAAELLIGQLQGTAFVELVTVSALELCVLGGPGYPLFEEPVAAAWAQLKDRRREKITRLVTEGMIERGLLTGTNSATGGEKGAAAHSASPALGIALAARGQPAFIVVTATADSSRRTPRFFALGDPDEPVRAVVVEEPAALPANVAGDFPNVKKLGILGRFYRYVLVSQVKAAAALAEWAIAPPPRLPGGAATSERAVTLYRHYAGPGSAGTRLGIRGDGTAARLLSPGADGSDHAPAEYDLAGLRTVMLDLIAARPR